MPSEAIMLAIARHMQNIPDKGPNRIHFGSQDLGCSVAGLILWNICFAGSQSIDFNKLTCIVVDSDLFEPTEETEFALATSPLPFSTQFSRP